MVIFARDAEIDLECNEIKDQLANQAILEAKHSVSKFRKNQSTGIIKISVSNKEKAESLIKNKVRIGFSFFKVQYDVRILQCFNCSKFGHHAGQCQNDAVCAKCAGNHLLKDCPHKADKEARKCANCNGRHFACSRSCQVMETQIRNKVMKISPSYASITSSSRARSDLNYQSHWPALSNQAVEPIKELQKSLENRLRDFQDSLEKKLKTALKIITSQFPL